MTKSEKIIEYCILAFIFFLPVFIPIGLIGFLIATIYLIFKKKGDFLKIEPTLFLFALYGLAFCVALSVIFSTDKLRSLGGFIPFLSYPLASILMIHAVWKEKVLRALILAGLVVVLFAIFQRVIGFRINLKFDILSTSASISGLTITLNRLNRVARYLVLSIPLGVGVFLKEKIFIWRLLAFIFVIAGIICMFITRSFAGIGTILILLILFVAIKNWKVGLLLIVAICAFVLIKPAIIERFACKYTSHHSWSIRVQTWRGIVMPMFKDYPLTGCGILNYTPVSSRYGGEGFLHAHAHSLYFHHLAETGILGIASLLFVIVVFLRSCIIPIKKASPVVLACAFSIIGVMIAGITESVFEFLPIGIFFWVVMGIGMAHHSSGNPGTQ